MKKGHAITLGIVAGVIILILTAIVGYLSGKNTHRPQAISVTNTPPPTIVVQTNAPSQVDMLAAEVEALKAANEEREARVQRLLALNEEVRRERETNVITIPVTVNVTNTPSSVTINGTFNVGGSSEAKKAATSLMERRRAPKTRTPMYTITNSTSSVTVSGTTTVSETHTSVQNFLPPGRRSLLGVILWGRANPIPTTVPSGQSVQQGQPPTPIVVVQQPYGYGYPSGYGGGDGYGYPYSRVPAYSGSCERKLFGVRFHTR